MRKRWNASLWKRKPPETMADIIERMMLVDRLCDDLQPVSWDDMYKRSHEEFIINGKVCVV